VRAQTTFQAESLSPQLRAVRWDSSALRPEPSCIGGREPSVTCIGRQVSGLRVFLSFNTLEHVSNLDPLA
jgi:hypothetical protein